MGLLIDSSVWIWYLGPKALEKFEAYILSARSNHLILTTGVIRQEIMLGAGSWKELLEMQLLFEHVPDLPAGTDIWTESARIGMRMKQKGLHLKGPDLLIAAVALENSVMVAHADRDFEYLAQHEGLKTESLLHLVE